MSCIIEALHVFASSPNADASGNHLVTDNIPFMGNASILVSIKLIYIVFIAGLHIQV